MGDGIGVKHDHMEVERHLVLPSQLPMDLESARGGGDMRALPPPSPLGAEDDGG